MYFANFPKIVYDFDLSKGTDYRVVTDITRNVRVRKQILENITLYDYYDIAEGETPEIISEKIYGTPYYHWVIMLVNQRYDYVNDFPLSQLELDSYIDEKYGVKKYHVHDYKVDGFIKEGVNTLVLRDSAIDGGGIGEMTVGKVLTSVTNGYEARIDDIIVESDNINVTIEVSLRTGKFAPNETVKIRDENTYAEVVSCVVPAQYTTTSNYDYEFNLNESKRRIKIVDPALVEQLVKEFKDIL
jgi:hypothetical protein